MLEDLIFDLVQTPGPSGFEGRVAQKIRGELSGLLDEIRVDEMGNLVATRWGKRKSCGQDGGPPGPALAVMAHMDEVSMVVREVDEFLWFERVGFINEETLPGTPVTVLTEAGDLEGVICSRPAHAGGRAGDTREPGGGRKLWIDVGGRGQARKAKPGDPIVFAANARWLDRERGVLASKAVDNRVGCAVLVGLARALKDGCDSTVHLVATVREEVGAQGAAFAISRIKADYLVAIDTAYAADAETHLRNGAASADGNMPAGGSDGPVLRRFQMVQPEGVLYPAKVFFSSRELDGLILDAAAGLGINVSLDIYTRTFTDSTIVAEMRPEIKCSTLMIPRRYAHSPNEVVDVTNAERCVRILEQVVHGLPD